MAEASKPEPPRRRYLKGLPTDVVALGLRPLGDTRELARQLARTPQLEETRKLLRRDPALAVATLRHAYKVQREQTKTSTDLDYVVNRLGTHAMQEVLKQVGKLEPLERSSPRALGIRDHSVRVAAIAGPLSYGLVTWTGWKWIEIPMTGQLQHWGGANDGVIHYPIRWETLLLVDNGQLRIDRPLSVQAAGMALKYE